MGRYGEMWGDVGRHRVSRILSEGGACVCWRRGDNWRRGAHEARQGAGARLTTYYVTLLAAVASASALAAWLGLRVRARVRVGVRVRVRVS